MVLFFAVAVFFIAFYFSLFLEKGGNLDKKFFLDIKGAKIEVEIANDAISRARGLSGRASLLRDCGMLFVFEEKQKTAFWMKDMLFDLDIIWIVDGKIAHIEENVKKEDKRIINPGILADMVLEINAGTSSRLGFKEGDEVFLR